MRLMPEQITVTGKARGRPVELRWHRGGHLDGDPFTILDVHDLVAVGREVGDGGIAIGPATLDGDPDLIVATLAAVLDEVDAVTGIDPEVLPRGAEA